MNVRTILQSLEALGRLADDDDVKVILRDVWFELKQVEQEWLNRPNGVDLLVGV